jgi:hypothetical protein
MKLTKLADEFEYQKEVISVGDVDLDECAYFYFDADNADNEVVMIKNAIDSIK